MQSLGNDFVVLDGVRQNIAMTTAIARHLADRHYGIGCDQLLMAEPAQNGADFTYRVFNPDGSEVSQCANGARCLARFLHDQGLSKDPEITVVTQNRQMRLLLQDTGLVSVDAGVPVFEPKEVPFVAEQVDDTYALTLGKVTVDVAVLAIGNPHAVLQVENIAAALVAELGPQVENHPRFPERTNVGFMQVLDRKTIALRVHERGTGETLACGSGACAAVVAGRRLGMLDEQVEVRLPGGILQIAWKGANEPVWMCGPATTVFEGRIETN